MPITSREGDTHFLQSAHQPSQCHHAHYKQTLTSCRVHTNPVSVIMPITSREGDTHFLQSAHQPSQCHHAHYKQRGRHSLPAECTPTQSVSSYPLQAERETLTICRVHTNPVSVIMPITSREGDTHSLQSAHQPSQCHHAHYKQRGRHSLAAECMPTQSVSSCPLQAERETLTSCRVHTNPSGLIMPITSREGDTHSLQSAHHPSQCHHAHYKQRGRHSQTAECTPTQSVSSCPLQAERETLTSSRVHTNPVSVIMPITSREGDTHSLQSAHQPSQCHHAHYKQIGRHSQTAECTPTQSVSSCPLQAERETLTSCRVHTNPVSVIMPITSREGDTHNLQSAHQPSQCHHAHYKQIGRHSQTAECTPTQSVSSCPLQAERETLTSCRVHTNPVSVIMPITSREGDTHSLQSAHQPSQCHHAHYKQRGRHSLAAECTPTQSVSS